MTPQEQHWADIPQVGGVFWREEGGAIYLGVNRPLWDLMWGMFPEGHRFVSEQCQPVQRLGFRAFTPFSPVNAFLCCLPLDDSDKIYLADSGLRELRPQ